MLAPVFVRFVRILPIDILSAMGAMVVQCCLFVRFTLGAHLLVCMGALLL